MRKFRFAVLVGLATAALVGRAGGASASSGVVGQFYINDNTARREHGRRLRPSRRRVADADPGLAVCGRRRRHRAWRTPRRARCS